MDKAVDDISAIMREIGQNARQAAALLASAPSTQKDDALRRAGDALMDRAGEIAGRAVEVRQGAEE